MYWLDREGLFIQISFAYYSDSFRCIGHVCFKNIIEFLIKLLNYMSSCPMLRVRMLALFKLVHS
jgi:hypothetical protein